ncbi:Transcription factor IWS1 [Galdieria sulphuraria]|uniref:TFIIS N-terminal domain-containing protein n=1 Tax=Galdieria sulphuraria TaxID=130081 RepID=M2VTC6_GALSU|nr:uncharacterized protein Gasu_59330 [Galdieria sulphuraria]EME26446.1 hypothetical protein Gasu_59330 [Galdieria sulphuraria]GJD12315.1 Transcription factor IWS1 [Galdieria sulphuraria]|eukprot:XP_005702966.1 hypothetical protein Gasu_59330 [Galdieria sulphuraria]
MDSPTEDVVEIFGSQVDSSDEEIKRTTRAKGVERSRDEEQEETYSSPKNKRLKKSRNTKLGEEDEPNRFTTREDTQETRFPTDEKGNKYRIPRKKNSKRRHTATEKKHKTSSLEMNLRNDESDEEQFVESDDNQDAPAESSKVDDLLSNLKKSKNKKEEKNIKDLTEEVDNFLRRMMKAADDDLLALKAGKPATNKLKLVEEVEKNLRRVEYRELFLEQGLLSVVKRWLDPLPDGSLPNASLRSRLLKMLDEFPVDNSWMELLRSSDIGRAVKYISVNDRMESTRRLAKDLVEKWIRPVFNAKTDYRDFQTQFRRVPVEEIGELQSSASSAHNEDNISKRLKIPTYRAAIPQPVSFNFQAMPDSSHIAEALEERKGIVQPAALRKIERRSSSRSQYRSKPSRVEDYASIS